MVELKVVREVKFWYSLSFFACLMILIVYFICTSIIFYSFDYQIIIIIINGMVGMCRLTFPIYIFANKKKEKKREAGLRKMGAAQ